MISDIYKIIVLYTFDMHNKNEIQKENILIKLLSSRYFN